MYKPIKKIKVKKCPDYKPRYKGGLFGFCSVLECVHSWACEDSNAFHSWHSDTGHGCDGQLEVKSK